jgi:prepilin-type N-terminal cleavage/methylation domain-containing protein
MYKFTNKKGFTLLEMIISVFIFVLVMLSVVNIFIKIFGAYNATRNIQKDLENAQYAMNSMGKFLRESSIVTACTTPPCNNWTIFRIFDYSQGRCIEYSYSGNALKMRSSSIPTSASVCTNYPFTLAESYLNITSGHISKLVFSVIPSVGSPPTSYGKVTISLEISATSSSTDKARMQTTVALRN